MHRALGHVDTPEPSTYRTLRQRRVACLLHTRSFQAPLSRITRLVTPATVRRVTRGFDTNRTAQLKPFATRTLAFDALLRSITRHAARATVRAISLQVDTGFATLFQRTSTHALALVTGFQNTTLIIAGTAVFRITLDIDTLTVALCLPLWTLAHAIFTQKPFFAV